MYSRTNFNDRWQINTPEPTPSPLLIHVTLAAVCVVCGDSLLLFVGFYSSSYCVLWFTVKSFSPNIVFKFCNHYAVEESTGCLAYCSIAFICMSCLYMFKCVTSSWCHSLVYDLWFSHFQVKRTYLCSYFTLLRLMGFSIEFDTGQDGPLYIPWGYSLHVILSKIIYYFSGDWFCLSKQCRSLWNAILIMQCGISTGASLFAIVPV